MKRLDVLSHSAEVQACGLWRWGLWRRRGPGQRGRRATWGDWRTQCGVTLGLFLLCMFHAPALWRPELDYCAGIQAQSVFIRERAKIIQEGSGPLIHLKRRMKGRGGLSGGDLKGGLWVILKGESPVERPWEPQWINTLWIILTSFYFLFFRSSL